ncbi:acyl-CoA desaturase [Humisphaera borealis]|uniref:Acyl-CoA desaturase n=1 Tax=Humisphaera borealis TaxID=2807512 RepID=A0A7M2WZ67_9BACT|nr:acyl-CoA desaturase [Humisphaera borealis]QOV90776.1 acyl-CoA desaturase [Humisphaera borealis]
MIAVTMWVTVLLPYIGLAVAVGFAFAGGIAWIDMLVMAVCYLAVGFGVTIGYHRLLTHRAFTTHRWVEAIFYILGCMAAQGPPVRWAATHRRHHQNSDDHGDPHSPNLHGSGPLGVLRGLWHAHTGWLLHRDAPDVARSVNDLVASPLVRFVDRLYGFWILLGILIPFAVGLYVKGTFTGGLVTMFWGAIVRVVVMHHATWSVNSICHLFGYRTFKSGDMSRNNPIVAALALGEGWHNNHHAFPTSAQHGLKKYEIDLSYLVIRFMERARLVWDVRRPSAAAQQVKALS